MKSSIMPYLLPLLDPFTKHLTELYDTLEKEVYALTGSKCFIFKGDIFCRKKHKSDNIVLLPESLRPNVMEFLEYRQKLEDHRVKMYNYLRQVKMGKSCSFLAYLPKSCHFLYDATTTTHEIPSWVDDFVCESLMLRSLYELS